MNGTFDRDFRLDEPGRLLRTPVAGASRASLQASLVVGSWSTTVLTVVVSNDPTGNRMENHPDGITLTASGITAAFRVSGFLWYGVKLTTGSAAEAIAEVSLRPA